MLKIYLKLLQKYRPSAGWTLAELMIAAAMTLIVVMVAGFGLVTILRENKVANATGEMQYDMNRAAEFISEEIRGAKTIETNLADIQQYAPTFFEEHPDATPILALKIDGVYERVIYYVDEVADGDIWRGPAVIRRFGPAFNDDGEHKEEQKRTPGDWQSGALVDMMLTTIPADQKKCRDKDPSLTDPNTYITTDDEGQEWHRLPVQDDDVTGFFACVRGDKQLVEFHLAGTTIDQLDHVSTVSPNSESRFRDKMEYNVTTMVHARSESVGSGGEDVPGFSVSQNIVLQDEGGKGTIKVLHAAVPCEGDPGNTSKDVQTSFIGLDISSGASAVSGEGSGNPETFESGKEIITQVEETRACTEASQNITRAIQPSELQQVRFTTNDNSDYTKLNDIIPSPSSQIITKLTSKNLIKQASDGSGNYYFTLADNQVLYFVEFETEQFNMTTFKMEPQNDPPNFDDVIYMVELSK